MRVFGQSTFIVTLALAAMLSPAVSITRAQAPARDAAAVLAEAREALGGEKRLSAVKNFVVTGRTRQVRGDNLVPIEFEIAVELPDKYVRKDEIPAQESGPTSTGFSGDELIQLPVPVAPPAPPPGAGGRAGAPPPSPGQLETMRKARVAGIKQDFVRLTLGMFAGSFSAYPLTFTYVGQAEAPQGKADVVEAKAPNFTMRLFVNSQTHLPIMVSWQAPARPAGPPRGTPPAGAPAGQTMPPGATPSGAAQAGARAGQAPPAPLPSPAPAGQGAPAAPGARPAPGQPPPADTTPPPALPGAAAPGAPAGQAPPPLPGAGQAGPGRGVPAAPVEFRIYYADYRDVDGLQWPFRLRRATGTDTTEETTFDRFRVNTKIDPRKFEVRK